MEITKQSTAIGVGFGVIFAGLGVMIHVMYRLDPELARAPGFVLDAAAGCFFFAGISVIARALNAPLLARLCALPVAYLLAVPGLWIMLGNSGECSVTHIASGASTTNSAPGTTCQLVFGGGALVVLVFAVTMTVHSIRSGVREARPSAPPENAQR